MGAVAWFTFTNSIAVVLSPAVVVSTNGAFTTVEVGIRTTALLSDLDTMVASVVVPLSITLSSTSRLVPFNVTCVPGSKSVGKALVTIAKGSTLKGTVNVVPAL